MLQHNTVVCTISLPDSVKDDKIYRKSILPRLEMNRSCFEAERQAMNRADYSIRAKLLGRALHVVRFNPNLLFQFLSENVPAFVRSEKDPIIISGQKRKAQSSWYASVSIRQTNAVIHAKLNFHGIFMIAAIFHLT
jgi:hypothetical protein